MMQAADQEPGITYGTLLGYLISSALVLGLTGSAGYFLAKATDHNRAPETTAPADAPFVPTPGSWNFVAPTSAPTTSSIPFSAK